MTPPDGYRKLQASHFARTDSLPAFRALHPELNGNLYRNRLMDCLPQAEARPDQSTPVRLLTNRGFVGQVRHRIQRHHFKPFTLI